MLSVLTLEKAGRKDTLEMFTSTPEGEDLYNLVRFFHKNNQHWTIMEINDDWALLRDSRGDYWVAQSIVFEYHYVIDYSDR